MEQLTRSYLAMRVEVGKDRCVGVLGPQKTRADESFSLLGADHFDFAQFGHVVVEWLAEMWHVREVIDEHDLLDEMFRRAV